MFIGFVILRMSEKNWLLRWCNVTQFITFFLILRYYYTGNIFSKLRYKGLTHMEHKVYSAQRQRDRKIAATLRMVNISQRFYTELQ